jgi:hypothetical protein
MWKKYVASQNSACAYETHKIPSLFLFILLFRYSFTHTFIRLQTENLFFFCVRVGKSLVWPINWSRHVDRCHLHVQAIGWPLQVCCLYCQWPWHVDGHLRAFAECMPTLLCIPRKKYVVFSLNEKNILDHEK